MSRVMRMWLPRSIHFEMAFRQSLGDGTGLSSYLSKLSIAGMVIAVAFLIASLSVMNGFEREMRLRILDLVPHLTIRSYLQDASSRELPLDVSALPNIVRTYRFSEANVLLYAKAESRVGRIVYAESKVLQPLQLHLTPRIGRLAPGEIILGKNLAESLEVNVGESLVALVSEEDGGRRFDPEAMKLAAILDSGTEIDRVFALADTASRSNLEDVKAPAWAMSIADPLEAHKVSRFLRRSLGPQYWISDWTRSLGNLYQAIQLSRQIVGLMLIALLVVAVFNIVTSLVLVTADRRPSSAMLRAMGASPSDVLIIFTIQGTIIGAGGAVLGAILGAALTAAIPGFVSIIETVSGQPLLDTSVYPLAYVPVDLRWWDFFNVASVAFALSLIACIFPAISASRASISDALRESR